MFFWVLVVLLVAFVLWGIQFFLSEKLKVSDAPLSSVESGFENVYFNNFYSSSFFFLAVLYVLFDMELVVFLPLVFNLSWYVVSVVLCFVVLITLSLEWLWCGLFWVV